ncbi:TVP38/TMEM64 family protein [Wenzhouxiangella sp. XN201]|uniref:TVP38/TMEM64 family protein n=1 Tax=Wenzhouxiangella sp. XN201 TaxID=2710755 RepID=UPI0013CA879F|nr:VTT domain-containing protein [Wenzhouxiangella sp. XN201]NEZ03620.1 TVP38/TMEM64 family protein [Wenzhouxiangella sp. XN201]
MQHKRIKFALATLTLSVVMAFAIGLTDAGQGAAFALIERLEGWVDLYFWPGVLGYVLAFAILITLTLPMATLFTVTGGFLFGASIGSAAALAGMTLGAMLTFSIMRLLKVREDSTVLRHGRAQALFELMDRNAVFYVTLLRIVPVAPCFAVNAGAAITRIDFPRFTIASLVGLTPSAIVYGGLGAGLETILEARRVLSPTLLLEPRIGLPLLGVVVLVVASWLLRRHLPGLSPEA